MAFAINSVTVTSAGTAVQFTTDTAPYKNITVRARPNNSSLAYVGDSSVNSTAGFALNPGEAHVFNAKQGIGIRLSDLYADAAASNDVVDYWAYNE